MPRALPALKSKTGLKEILQFKLFVKFMKHDLCLCENELLVSLVQDRLQSLISFSLKKLLSWYLIMIGLVISLIGFHRLKNITNHKRELLDIRLLKHISRSKMFYIFSLSMYKLMLCQYMAKFSLKKNLYPKSTESVESCNSVALQVKF